MFTHTAHVECCLLLVFDVAGLMKSLFVKRLFCFIVANQYTRQSRKPKPRIFCHKNGGKYRDFLILTCKFLWSVRKNYLIISTLRIVAPQEYASEAIPRTKEKW